GFQVPSGQRHRVEVVRRVRRDQAEEALWPRVHRHRAQYLPDRSGKRGPRRMAQGQGPRPRRRGARHPQDGTIARMTRQPRIYVLDTNVLMHDPTALFKFDEPDVYLPMQVMEELDNAKKGTSEASRNARQVSRFLNELIESDADSDITNGIVLQRPQGLQLRGAQSK